MIPVLITIAGIVTSHQASSITFDGHYRTALYIESGVKHVCTSLVPFGFVFDGKVVTAKIDAGACDVVVFSGGFEPMLTSG